MKVIKFLLEVKDKTVDAVRNFTDDPIDNLGVICPVLAGLTAVIGFIAAYIMFIRNGGYVSQVKIQENACTVRAYMINCFCKREQKSHHTLQESADQSAFSGYSPMIQLLRISQGGKLDG